MKVDDLPVVCHNWTTCDYTYVKPVGEITGATYDDATKKLIITGVDLPLLAGYNYTAAQDSSTASNSTTNTASSGGRRLLKDLR